ncbi:MAG: N-6 DNA methylase [Chloroflexi bacterium]|nr:N-6 DNA methylase [Chloroflexota bacterium]
MSVISDYLSEIQSKYKTDVAGEHAYRPALEKLLQSADAGLNAVNDPARTAIGMPDFVVLRQPGNVPIGIVEAKDIGNQLSRTEKTGQIKRYLAHGNLILTNYLEFRWYVNGEKIETVRIARVKSGKITRISTAYGDLTNMLRRFAQQTTQSVNSAQELAERLARSAQFIAHFIEKDLKSSTPSANLQNQMAAFQKTLLPDLDIASFADMYAQTLAYGLFASRVNYPGDPSKFSLLGAAEDIPRTNPFLRDLFYHSRFDIGKRLTWMAESLVEILRHTDMDSILAHFGRRTAQTDPVLHFYETFLRAYNPSLRETRGVYYTPEPVVKYIVRSVDHILKTRFDRPRGLADENALILDPAVGTGTFLYFVIEQIKEAFAGQQGLWKSYVREHLLPRLFGFELLMAPYTVAHMNLSLQLKDAGYDFKEGERLGIYLTNSLEEAVEAPPLPFANFIVEEANTAAEIKRDKPIMVVLGNPPYSIHSENDGKLINQLMERYKALVRHEQNIQPLSDDYIKFLRFAHDRIERTGHGVIGFITNHTYLTGLLHRGMRSELIKSFDEIYILDLHGNYRRGLSSPDGAADENVFDIGQGVAIVVLVKLEKSTADTGVYHFELWGKRPFKYRYLKRNSIRTTRWNKLQPSSPNYFFAPHDDTHSEEYNCYVSVENVFGSKSTGFETGRDAHLIQFDKHSIRHLVADLANQEISPAKIEECYSIRNTSGWNVSKRRTALFNKGYQCRHNRAISYRPFDSRFTYYHGLLRRAQWENLRHTLRDNLALIASRIIKGEIPNHAFVSTLPVEKIFLSPRTSNNAFVFPLYLFPKTDEVDTGDDASEFPLSHKGRRPNLSKAFVADMETKLGLPFQTEGSAFAEGDDAPDCFGPEDVFYYAYAIFHSPTYRERYAEFLKIDFPRLPLTADLSLFANLVKLGAELVDLHLMKSAKLSDFITTFDIEGDNEVARGFPKYNEVKQCVEINKTQYFGGISPEIWDFHIGGYRVADKWLKDRRGRKLAYEDLKHYQKIIVALSETRRIMSEIDAAIPRFPIA